MGVKLEWDIEAEKGKKKQHREDRQHRGARYRGVFRLFLTIAVFVAIIAGVVYFILDRLEQVNQEIERVLSETVQAEIADLRLGDLTAFEQRQRSATEDWLETQRQVFNDYQALKLNSDVVLSGRILDVVVDGQRGRVQVEEIIDGVPYVQTWYYWNYPPVRNCNETAGEDCRTGWLHVPPDYTFRGASNSIENDDYVIRYSEIDAPLANQLDEDLQRWLNDACLYIACDTIPLITVDIAPAPGVPVHFADNDLNAWHIIVPSPYTGRARADIPFDSTLQIQVASLLAERILTEATNGLEPIFASDASYLRESIHAWTVGRFVQLNPQTHLVQSLVDNYQISSVQSLLQNLQATSTMSILAAVTGNESVGTMNLDWRDYVLWRLELEDDLITNRNEAAWVALYDFSGAGVRDAAYQRFLNNLVASNRTVTSANVLQSEAGITQLIVTVNVTRGFESGEEIIVFSLVNGNWLRAN